jgi:hypothetical protein
MNLPGSHPSLLHLAVASGSLEMTERLLVWLEECRPAAAGGAPTEPWISEAAGGGLAPVHLAALLPATATAELLLRRSLVACAAWLALPCAAGRTPAALAAARGAGGGAALARLATDRISQALEAVLWPDRGAAAAPQGAADGDGDDEDDLFAGDQGVAVGDSDNEGHLSLSPSTPDFASPKKPPRAAATACKRDAAEGPGAPSGSCCKAQAAAAVAPAPSTAHVLAQLRIFEGLSFLLMFFLTVEILSAKYEWAAAPFGPIRLITGMAAAGQLPPGDAPPSGTQHVMPLAALVGFVMAMLLGCAGLITCAGGGVAERGRRWLAAARDGWRRGLWGGFADPRVEEEYEQVRLSWPCLEARGLGGDWLPVDWQTQTSPVPCSILSTLSPHPLLHSVHRSNSSQHQPGQGWRTL